MCTATWIRGELELELFFNRDESRGRGPETPPCVHERPGTRYLAPGDSDGGGTWIAVSDSGLCLALLNAYVSETGAPGRDTRSRGLLIPQLIDARTPAQVAERAVGADLACFRPFVLLAIAPGTGENGLRRLHWDGARLQVEDTPRMPLCSSGVRQAEASAFRARLLERHRRAAGALTVSVLERFHRSHEGGPSALTPCMHRAEAETKSACHVSVSAREVRMRYLAGPPCRTARGSPVDAAGLALLPRRGAHGSTG